MAIEHFNKTDAIWSRGDKANEITRQKAEIESWKYENKALNQQIEEFKYQIESLNEEILNEQKHTESLRKENVLYHNKNAQDYENFKKLTNQAHAMNAARKAIDKANARERERQSTENEKLKKIIEERNKKIEKIDHDRATETDFMEKMKEQNVKYTKEIQKLESTIMRLEADIKHEDLSKIEKESVNEIHEDTQDMSLAQCMPKLASPNPYFCF